MPSTKPVVPIEDQRANILHRATPNGAEPTLAQEGLRASEIRYRRLFEAARDGILILNAASLKITDVNPFMTDLLGYSHEEFLGKELWEIGLFSDKKASQQAFRELQKTGYIRYEDLPLQTVEGTLREVEFVSNVYEEGTRKVIQCNIRDITEHKRAKEKRRLLLESALESAQAAHLEADTANSIKDEFLAVVSHELRTPLTSILGWSDLLTTGDLDDTESKRALEIIVRNARAQRQLIDDLLDISRIISGKLRLEVCPVKLAPMIEAVVDGVRPAADARNIHLLTALDSLAGPVSGDPERLQQIIWNLLSNAIKFTGKGGSVAIRLERVHSHIEIIISDTGQGISPEFLLHVFDRFRQSDSSSTRRHGGLGLGLSIVRQLVELHGGTVMVDSPGEGEGTTFKVMLPMLCVHHDLAEPDMTRTLIAGGTPVDWQPSLDHLRVLVVDDEPDARDLIAAVLIGRHAEVVSVESGGEALAAMGRQQFDVLVSDIGMPLMDGYALIERVRQLPAEHGGRIPAAALTAYAGAEDRMRALTAGYQMHIAKPVEPAKLTTVVASLAGRYAKPLTIN
ncbi:MAG: ATP-binding protein [Pyrinomonadaceae bacterium]|nr:ATP-binding protein [Pyrinomonadaceae bacterium]